MLLRTGHNRPKTKQAKTGITSNGALATLAVQGHKKAPDDAGAFELLIFSRDQYFATTGPAQLKR